MLSAEEQSRLDAQVALSRSLALGFALSFLPAAGVGSIAAIAIGVRGWKKIRSSGHKLVGAGLAAWCIAAGIVGLVATVLRLGPIVARI